MTIAEWAWLVTAGVALLLGWLAAKLDDSKKATAYMVGLLVASIGSTVALYFEIITIRTDEAAVLSRAIPTLRSPIWNAVVQDIADYDRTNAGSPLEETLHEPLRRVISHNITQAREGYIEMADKNEVVGVTLKLLDRAQQSVRATSYIEPKEWWGSDIADTYSETLKATKRRIGVFQRIFIVASTEEAKALAPVMNAQQKAGLEVRYVCASTIPADQRDDFIVVDSAVAAELALGEQRQFKSARFFSTRVRATDFDNRFNNLWIGARPVSDIGKITCGNTSTK